MRAVRNANLEDCGAIAAVLVGWQAGYRGLMRDEFLDRLDIGADPKVG